MGDIREYGEINADYEQGLKVVIGDLRGELLNMDDLTEPELLPTEPQVLSGDSWPKQGTLTGGDWDNAIGLEISAGDFLSWCATHAGVYPDSEIYAGFLFGDVADEYRTYFCIEYNEITYTVDGTYTYVIFQGALTSRKYRTIPGGGGTILIEHKQLDTFRVRFDARGWATELEKVIVLLKNAKVYTVKLYTIGIIGVFDNGDAYVGDYSLRSYRRTWLESEDGLNTDAEPETEPIFNPALGYPGTPGGYGQTLESQDPDIGSFDDSSDTIPVDAAPSLNPFGLGFLNAYKISDNATWGQLTKALFPDMDFASATDLIDWLGRLTQVTFFKNRTEYILGCLAIPCNVPAGASDYVTAGGAPLVWTEQAVTYHVVANPVTSPFVDVDCGTIAVKKHWANFLDYVGTTAKLFLPGVGFIDIKPEYFNGGQLGVKYRFNVIDGSFMCYVTSTSGVSKLSNTLIGQYSGAMCVRLPLTGADYSQVASGLISAIGAAGAAVATGGAATPLTGSSVANLSNTLTAQPHMQNANSYNASSSYMSNRTPYLLIARKTSQFSENYMQEKGFPLNVYTKLAYCKGLTICDNPVINFPCTEEEAKEIKAALKEGIII